MTVSVSSQKAPIANGYLIYDPELSDLLMLGVRLLDRQLVALKRGGCEQITIISQGSVPELRRSRAFGIPYWVAPVLPAADESAIVAAGGAYFDAADVRQLQQNFGRLHTAGGDPVNVVSTTSILTETPIWDSPQPAITSNSAAAQVASPADATRLGKRLLRRTTSDNDGLVDRYLNRPISRLITQRLVHAEASPNLVSIIAILLGLLSAWCLSIPYHELAILGAILFQISAIIDCVDGDLARLCFCESRMGKWLDLIGDQIVHIAVFIGIGLSLLKASPSLAITLLTLSAAVGAGMAFVVVLWASHYTRTNQAIHRLINTTANRDFSILVLILALVDQLKVFVWLAGIGIHIYWIGILVLAFRSSPKAVP
ncbi:MAG: Bifunctional IPC transferase and DIPP synthase [Verrucomicrobia subdivision 3 bacterium]|nr:Bifunctional IPC transferase and DIPP synthase [Limisphaerales bacterium]MCS1412322.1 Bifunctional IPC transferase and DIPP synthase [Limisphaerales bacterium]